MVRPHGERIRLLHAICASEVTVIQPVRLLCHPVLAEADGVFSAQIFVLLAWVFT